MTPFENILKTVSPLKGSLANVTILSGGECQQAKCQMNTTGFNLRDVNFRSSRLYLSLGRQANYLDDDDVE